MRISEIIIRIKRRPDLSPEEKARKVRALQLCAHMRREVKKSAKPKEKAS